MWLVCFNDTVLLSSGSTSSCPSPIRSSGDYEFVFLLLGLAWQHLRLLKWSFLFRLARGRVSCITRLLRIRLFKRSVRSHLVLQITWWRSVSVFFGLRRSSRLIVGLCVVSVAIQTLLRWSLSDRLVLCIFLLDTAVIKERGKSLASSKVLDIWSLRFLFPSSSDC